MAIIDLTLAAPHSGFDVVEQVKARSRTIKTLGISSVASEYSIARVERSGFDAFVIKTTGGFHVIDNALTALAHQQKYFCPEFQRRRAQRRQNPLAFDKILSAHEIEAMRYFGLGWEDPDIARQFGITPKSAENLHYRIMNKFGVKTTTKFVLLCQKLGFTDLPHPPKKFP